MKNNKAIGFGAVQETALLPLWGRAVETQKEKPLLVDNMAVAIVNQIDYDFSTVEKNISELSRLAWVARSIYFDQEIKDFLEKYPDCSIINIGCGLDTTFDRVDNGKVNWYDLDLPDIIELRKRYIQETERRQFIAASVFDKGWYSHIVSKQHVLILIAGVMYYLGETSIQKLFVEFAKHFGKVEVLFDYSSEKGVMIANKKVIESGGINKKANLIWGINNIYELENWGNIKVLNQMPMFKKFKKNYPWGKRIGMMISDQQKIMALTHIAIER